MFQPRVPVLDGCSVSREEGAFYLCISLPPALLGLHAAAPASLSCVREQGLLSGRGARLLSVAASSLQAMSSQLCPGLAASRHVGPGAEPVVPTLVGGFSLTPDWQGRPGGSVSWLGSMPSYRCLLRSGSRRRRLTHSLPDLCLQALPRCPGHGSLPPSQWVHLCLLCACLKIHFI